MSIQDPGKEPSNDLCKNEFLTFCHEPTSVPEELQPKMVAGVGIQKDMMAWSWKSGRTSF